MFLCLNDSVIIMQVTLTKLKPQIYNESLEKLCDSKLMNSITIKGKIKINKS